MVLPDRGGRARSRGRVRGQSGGARAIPVGKSDPTVLRSAHEVPATALSAGRDPQRGGAGVGSEDCVSETLPAAGSADVRLWHSGRNPRGARHTLDPMVFRGPRALAYSPRWWREQTTIFLSGPNAGFAAELDHDDILEMAYEPGAQGPKWPDMPCDTSGTFASPSADTAASSRLACEAIPATEFQRVGPLVRRPTVAPVPEVISSVLRRYVYFERQAAVAVGSGDPKELAEAVGASIPGHRRTLIPAAWLPRSCRRLGDC